MPELGIPGYVDVEVLAEGGFGIVYRAWHPTFERSVAIKVLPADTDEDTARFERECAAVGSLSGHPNIVTVYDTGITTDGRRFIVMEFLPNGSLADRLAQSGPIASEEVLEIGVKLAGATESAHRAGILHGDIKPENVLLSGFAEPKLADFGIARIRGRPDHTDEVLSATIAHAAPEVLEGAQPTVGSDVYSLSSTLLCLLLGRPPFDDPTSLSLVSRMARIAKDPPPDLRGRGVPPQLCAVLEQGLAKAPAERQTDAAQLGRQLQAVQAALELPVSRLPVDRGGVTAAPDTTPRPVPTPPTEPRPPRRRRRLRWVAAPVLAVAAVSLLIVPGALDRARPLPSLYRDNFDAGQSWYEHDGADARLAYEDGQYRISAKQPNAVVLSDTSFRGGSYGEPLTELTDVSVRVTGRSTSGTAIFGVFCRDNPSGYYEGIIRTDGSALILKDSGAQGLTTLGSAEGVPLAASGPTAVRLDCIGRSPVRLTLFVDDRKVIGATDPGGLAKGSVGMLVASQAAPADVFFDDFVLLGRRAAD